MTTTTSFGAIRDNWVTLLEALTPTQAQEFPFISDPGTEDFAANAETNPSALFRVFAVVNTSDRAEIGASDTYVEQVTDTAQLVIAYPHAFGLYGDENLRDLDTLISEDARLIRKTLGELGQANYLAGQSITRADYSLDRAEGMTLLVFDLVTTYYQLLNDATTPPTAAFSSSINGRTVTFTDESTDGGGTVDTWAWAFGDNSSSSLQSPVYAYASNGTYTVSLLVTDNLGVSSESISHDVTVSGAAAASCPDIPTAAFSTTVSGLTATFTDESTEGTGTIDTWAWLFGDGYSSSAQNPAYAYTASGTYSASLIVTDDQGSASESVSHDVTVSGFSPPIAGFSTTTSGLTATFTDESTPGDGTINTWAWLFGDGNSSVSQNPVYSYTASGTYDASLIVTDDLGSASASVGHSVTVSGAAAASCNTVSNNFLGLVSNVADGTRPSSSYGTALTPGENTYGAYVEMIGAVAGTTLTNDAYVIEIIITEGNEAAEARDILVTLGFDSSGGTAYTDWTIDHLLGSAAGGMLNDSGSNIGPVMYTFPLFIQSGTSIAAKASVNNVTVGTVKCVVNLRTLPTQPTLVRTGTKVVTFGADVSASHGATVVAGLASEGVWVQLGSAISEANGALWYWEFGMGINDASVGYGCHLVDIGIGDASTKKMAITNFPVYASAIEAIHKSPAGQYMDGAVGDIAYGRIQASRTDLDISLIAYGVGD